MHIAVNALLVYGAFSGVQHAIMHQLRALLNCESTHRFSVIALQDVPIEDYIGPTKQPYEILRAPVRSGQRLQRILWEQLTLPEVLARANADLLYAPGYLTSLRWRGHSVVFIHDTIALSHPQLCQRGNALNYRLLLPPSARQATRVAVPSHLSARDVERYCRVPAHKIDVVPLGVVCPPTPLPIQIAAAREKLGISTPYLLAVSTIEPKKNFDSLIRWFTHWKEAGIPHHLVIVGKWGWKYEEVIYALGNSPCRDAIHLPGYLEQHELPAVMAGADLLLMPSRYEGFGLPVLEAMAVGTPVVVSDQGALPETVGDAGLVIPLDDLLWQAEIPTLLRYPERLQAMREKGIAWAAVHTWERTGALLLESFGQAAKETR